MKDTKSQIEPALGCFKKKKSKIEPVRRSFFGISSSMSGCESG